MSRAFERTALRGVLSLLTAVLLAACSSQGGVEERRRLAAEREKAARALETGAKEDLADDSFFDESVPTDESVAPKEEKAAQRGALQPRRGGGDARGVLRDMREDRTTDLEEALWWAQRGNEAFDQRRYDEAKRYYRRSLDLNPDDEAVRARWNLCLNFLNERKGEVASLSRQFIEELQVQREQTREEIRRNLTRGKARFDEGDLEGAERLVNTALHDMEQSPELVADEIRSDAKKLLERIRAERTRAEARERLERQRKVDEQVAQEIEQERSRRHRQVQDLLRKASRQIQGENYRKAAETCESILKLDPDNKVASFWRERSNEQLDKLGRLRNMLDREENKEVQDQKFVEGVTPHEQVVFPGTEEWLKVRKRAGDIHTTDFEESEQIKRIRNQLETRVIENINFDDTPLSEVIDTFRQIASVNMLISPDVDSEAEEFNVTQPITNLSAMSALKLILESKGLAFTFEENTLLISSGDEVTIDPRFEVYDVSDLLKKIRDFAAPEIRLRSADDTAGEAPISFTDDFAEEEETLDPDALRELIMNTTGGDAAWVEGTQMEFNRGQLFVDAPAELHRKVQGVLESLRQDSDLFVVIEARFIDVFDDFLEDIGIDSRALGLVNNLGTPFGNVINDNSTGGNDLGIVEQGALDDVSLVQGLDRWAGRVQHIIDGFAGTIRGERLNAGNGIGGATFQATWLEPFQANVILRLVQEKQDVRQLTAPIVTAHNNERVYVSVITQRAYIADYELVSGGTGFSIIEVADPVVQTFQEGVILDVDPTVSHDKKYVTLDVRPTLATLIGGVISTINISLGSFTNVAFQVPIGIPQIALQQSFTSVTVPNGGTVLLGGFRSMDDGKFVSYLPILGKIPIVKNLARRKATITEKRSMVILLSARIVDLRGREGRMYSQE